MSKDLTDINNLPFVFDSGNQSELIPADVEDCVLSDNVRVPEIRAPVCERCPASSAGD
jgi:hypothetical protein